MTGFGVRRALCALTLSGVAGAPAALSAQMPVTEGTRSSGGSCTTPSVLMNALSERSVMSPLDRRVSMSAIDLTLPDALDRLASAADIRISYSRELLPAKATTCFHAKSVAIGDVLTHLLRGSDLEPVITGSGLVVLRGRLSVPATASRSRGDSASRVQTLAPIIVTGASEEVGRAEAHGSVTSIAGDELVKRDVRSLRDLFEGAAPGMWAWDQPPSTFLTQYASLRGASSFGASSPKTYIDGIEVANPLVVTMLDPEHIARIEFIRGPQGAALHGADALSGVVKITTRREGAADGGLDVRVRSSGGMVESRYSASALIAQGHSLTLRAGSGTRSFALAVAGENSGSYIPGSKSQQLNALATGRRIGSHAILGMTARFATASALSPADPSHFAGETAGPGIAASVRSSLRQYTLGATAELLPTGRWRHSFVAGIDGYRLSDGGPMADRLHAELSDVDLPPGADRASLRASSVYQLSGSDRVSSTVTFGAEHAALRQTTELSSLAGKPVASTFAAQWRSNTGLSTQLDFALSHRVFFTGGLRMERLASGLAPGRLVALPMLGAGVVASHHDLTLTLRGAYGKGIRAPRAERPDLAVRRESSMALRRNGLLPEEQQGTEASVKLAVGRALSLQVTRFDQLASGLVQQVALGTSGQQRAIQLQNVGEIVNRGWEIEQSLDVRNLSIFTMLSLTESRVKTVAAGYQGELGSGDRMLDVPALTAGVNVGYSLPSASLSIGLSHARNWVGYDMLALRANGTAAGAGLRDYWRAYSGVTGLRASISRDIGRGLRIVMTGDNLLDVQGGAPDNATLLPGRTTTLSLRATF